MKHSGFTLVELVIVIVILGILAVVAAPSFIDFSSNAKASVIRGIEATISNNSKLVFAKAAAQKRAYTGQKERLTINSLRLNTSWGYPYAGNPLWKRLLPAENYDAEGNCQAELCVQTRNARAISSLIPNYNAIHGDKITTVSPKGSKSSDNCFAYYVGYQSVPDSVYKPLIGSVTSGCGD